MRPHSGNVYWFLRAPMPSDLTTVTPTPSRQPKIEANMTVDADLRLLKKLGGKVRISTFHISENAQAVFSTAFRATGVERHEQLSH